MLPKLLCYLLISRILHPNLKVAFVVYPIRARSLRVGKEAVPEVRSAFLSGNGEERGDGVHEGVEGTDPP